MGNSEEEQRNSGTAEQQSKMKFAVVNILVVLVGLSYLQYASAKTLPKAGGEDAVKVVENEIKKLGGNEGKGMVENDIQKEDVSSEARKKEDTGETKIRRSYGRRRLSLRRLWRKICLLNPSARRSVWCKEFKANYGGW